MEKVTQLHIDLVLKNPAVPLVQGRKGWVTSHDFARTLNLLETALEILVVDGKKMIEKFEKACEEE